ncbi:hypothetical protein X975_18981, partial [Stegodyphus mimosarum]
MPRGKTDLKFSISEVSCEAIKKYRAFSKDSAKTFVVRTAVVFLTLLPGLLCSEVVA